MWPIRDKRVFLQIIRIWNGVFPFVAAIKKFVNGFERGFRIAESWLFCGRGDNKKLHEITGIGTCYNKLDLYLAQNKFSRDVC